MNIVQSNIILYIGFFSILGILGYLMYSIKRAGGMNSVLKSGTNLVNNAESAWLNLLAALIPYAVSLIPAMMTYRHALTQLDVYEWEALNIGIAVEFFGIVTMDTAIRFWHNNKKYTSDKSGKKAPLGMAIGAYLFYLLIIITVNVVLSIATSPADSLHWFSGAQFWRIVALSLLSTLGVPSGMVVAMRTQHKEILNEKKQPNQPKPQQVNDNQPREAKVKKDKHASDFAPQIVAMLEKTWESEKRVLAPKEITARLKLDHDKAKGYVSTKTTEWKMQKGINPPFP